MNVLSLYDPSKNYYISHKNIIKISSQIRQWKHWSAISALRSYYSEYETFNVSLMLFSWWRHILFSKSQINTSTLTVTPTLNLTLNLTITECLRFDIFKTLISKHQRMDKFQWSCCHVCGWDIGSWGRLKNFNRGHPPPLRLRLNHKTGNRFIELFLSVLRAVFGNDWDADMKTLLILYRTLIRSVIELWIYRLWQCIQDNNNTSRPSLIQGAPSMLRLLRCHDHDTDCGNAGRLWRDFTRTSSKRAPTAVRCETTRQHGKSNKLKYQSLLTKEWKLQPEREPFAMKTSNLD